MCSALFQCISPGLVETGFAFKLHDNDPERAAATYESIRVGHGDMGAEGSGSDRSLTIFLLANCTRSYFCRMHNAFQNSQHPPSLGTQTSDIALIFKRCANPRSGLVSHSLYFFLL